MEKIIKSILEKENLSYEKLIKVHSGFTNLVYFIDNKFVIKLSQDNEIKQKLNKEISIYKNISRDYMPKYIASGEYFGYVYLIISKLDGKTLYEIWHTTTLEDRKSIIAQIVNILKDFHRQQFDFMDNEYKNFSWIEVVSKELSDKSKALKKLKFNTTMIDRFIYEKVPILFKENQYALVYNDAHFDNFILNDGKISLIDFDRVRVCPVDYEMLIIKTMCDNPTKFASEKDEKNIIDKDYFGLYECFKTKYPEMFSNENVDKRIFIYQFNYLMEQAIEINDMKWIGKLLYEFENHIL